MADDGWVDYVAPAPAQDGWVDYVAPAQSARAQAPADEWVDYQAPPSPPQQEPIPEAEGKLATAGRELAHGVVPGAAGAWAGMAAGAALGSAVPGLGTLAGGIIGGLGGGLLGGYAASTVQEKALNALGFDDSLQRAVNAKENPWSSAGGAALSAVAGGGPGALTRAAAPGVAAITGKQALGIRAASGAIGGGFEAGSQLAQGEELDPARIAATAAGGAVFAKPYGWGNRAGEVGENIGARWRDRPRAQPHGAAGPDANASTAAEPPPVSKREDVGDPHNPMGEGSEVEYMKPRDSATGDNVGTHVIPPGEIDPTLKTALAAENAKAEPAPPPAQPEPPPRVGPTPEEEAAAVARGRMMADEQPTQAGQQLEREFPRIPQEGERPVPFTREQLGRTPDAMVEPGVPSGPPVTPPAGPRVTIDPATGQMRMPKLTDEQFAGGIQALTERQREAGGSAPLPTAGQQARNQLEAGLEATRGRTDDLEIPSFLDRRTPKPSKGEVIPPERPVATRPVEGPSADHPAWATSYMPGGEIVYSNGNIALREGHSNGQRYFTGVKHPADGRTGGTAYDVRQGQKESKLFTKEELAELSAAANRLEKAHPVVDAAPTKVGGREIAPASEPPAEMKIRRKAGADITALEIQQPDGTWRLAHPPGETVSPALKNARRLNAEGGPTYPHASLARPKLEALIKAADEESSRINQAMIDAGRGHERPTDIRDMTDQLSMDKKAISEWQRGLNEEMRRRLKGHGKRTPLPKEYRDTFYAGESLRQDVLERGRSGRPIRTEPLPIGSEQQILEAGMAKATGPKGEPREPEMLAARRKPPKDPDAPDAAIDAAAAKATEAIDRATANKVANQLGARVKKAIELGVTPESLKAHADAVLKGTDPPPLSPITTRGWVKGEPLPPSATRGTPSVTSPVGGGVPPGGTAAAAGAAAGAPPGGTPPIPPNVGAAAAAGAGGGGGPTTPNMGHTPPQQQSWLKELWRDVKRKTAAHTLGPEAMEARYLIRSSSGEKHRLAEQTIDLIRGHKDHIDSMSPADHAALIDHAQGGNHFPNFQPTAEQKLYLRDRERSMQEWEAVLHQLPAADQMQFREKYMAQMYENPQAAGGRVFTGMGKRGSAGSTKQRKYDTYMDAEAAGLIRKYNNPIEIDSRYINSIKDFVISRDVVQRGADAGIIQWFDNPKIVGASGSPEPKVTGGPPPGMKELNGVPMKGNSKTAYAPDDFADVYNNFYDKGFGTTPEKATVVEAVRNSANAWTSLELGLNAYHLFTMANEAVITDLTKGFNNILVGQVRKGLKQIAMSPLAPETMRREGKKFQQEYLDPNSTNPIAMILAEANARPIGRGHAADYTFQERGAFINKLSNIEGQLKQARKEIGEDFNKAFGPNATESKILFPLRQAGRILQTTAAPIFDKYIPMLKAGAVHSQFKDWHEAMVAKNPAFDMVNNPADRRTAVNAGMKIVDSVDNRFGEAIHDNAFMNGMLKQGLMTMMRSYSWTVGAMKEIGGGSAAAGQALYTLGKTRGAENRFDMTHKDWDPRMAYPLALTFAVSTISTIYQMLRAGEGPESWRDLYAPKTGGTVPGVGGKGMVKEHVLMPGYQKDVLGWAMHPAQEAYNKMGGLPTTAIEQLTGKDWRGDPIVRADANALEGFGQRLGHVLGKLSPISVKNMTKGSEPTSAITWPEKAIGFRAPGAHIQDPVGLKRAMDFKDRRIQKAIDKRERKIQLRQNPQISP